MCADSNIRPTIEAVFGSDACQRGSAFYTTSTRYERGLLVSSARGDPATGSSIVLTPDQIRQAFSYLRAAETALVSCEITNTGRLALKVTIYPDPGFVVADNQGTFVLDPSKTRKVLLRPGQDISPPRGQQPTCSWDRNIADKEYKQPYPREFFAAAVAFAAIAAVVAGYAAWSGANS